MIEDFVKWMASLDEFEREQKMDTLINLFAPNPSHEDFKRLKGALKRKEKRIKELENQIPKIKQSAFDDIYTSICRDDDYPKLKKQVISEKLYRNLATANNELQRKNLELQSDITTLLAKLGQLANE